MPSVSDIAPATLRVLLDCDPESGVFSWKPRASGLVKGGQSNRWNSRFAGKRALSTAGWDGYLTGRIQGVQCLTHRVMWAWVHGEWPEGEIDHINGIRDDNRIANLRLVTRQENAKNQRRYKTNTSGYGGVYRHAANDRWTVKIQALGKLRYVGRFEHKFDAVLARLNAERELGFHHNHGSARS